MLEGAINLTIKGFSATITNVLTISPGVSGHLKNYIATSVRDDRKEVAKELLKALEKDAKSDETKQRHFSSVGVISETLKVARVFNIHPLMIVLLLVAFIFSLLQIPNLGVRISNLLRNKFHISRRAQAAIAETFNFLSKVAKDVTSIFSKVLENMFPAKPVFSIKPFQDTLINLSQNPKTKVGLRRAVNSLNDREKNIINDLLAGTKGANFSRMPFNPRLHTQLSLEQGQISDAEEAITIARVITQMLSFPGVGQVVMILVSQFIPISLLTLMLGGSLIGIAGSIGTKGLDSLQRLRDQMVAYNSLV